MADDTNGTPPTTPPPVVCAGTLRQRDPPIFSGTDDKDVEDWLSTYERVSAHNKWADDSKLGHVSFYLSEVAKLWFLNHEAELTTWSDFKRNFTQVFDRPEVRKLRAEQRLRTRCQQTGENFTSYIEDIINLCGRVNASMSEAEKIKNIMKGIEDDAFQMLLSKAPSTVVQVTELCQSYDELRRQRLQTRRPSAPDDSLSSLGIGDEHAPLLQKIQEFIRAEVARQLSLLPCVPGPQQPLTPTLRDFVQEQVAQAISPACEPPPVTAPLTYADVVARPRPQTLPPPSMHGPPTSPYGPPTGAYGPPSSPYGSPSIPYGPPTYSPPSLPQPGRQQFPASQPRLGGYVNQWRTPDNRPICYACGSAGHVARLCHRRMLPFSNTRRAPFFPPHFSSAPSSLPPASFYPDGSSAPTQRSPSPRRRSLSPMRRRPGPTEQEN